MRAFGDRVVSWISLDEGGQLLDRLTRLGLIALRAVHLIEVRHSQLELRVSCALVRRVERHELPELVRGEDERLGRMLAHACRRRQVWRPRGTGFADSRQRAAGVYCAP